MTKNDLSKLRLFFGCTSFFLGMLGVFCGSATSCLFGVFAGFMLALFWAAMCEKEDEQ